MSALEPRLGLAGVLALRQRILERSEALAAAAKATAAASNAPTPPKDGAGAFVAAMGEAIRTVAALQKAGDAKAAAYERGETHDIASVMLARQKAAIAFEATLQARNRLLGAYRDIMNMPL
ncbi:flagellar hook-basal body complex protein FliE [Thermaurantiacus sp.]